MISQRQMKEWIPEAVEQFKAAMPPIDVPYPEIVIASDKTAPRIREEIVSRLHSPQKNPGKASAMETIHGEAGDAIIIYQNHVKDNPFRPLGDENAFKHYLWHELGHFYSCYTECPGAELYRYMDQQPRVDDADSQIGYWFWTEFVAEVIACHIDPDVDIDWKTFNRFTVRKELGALIKEAFSRYEDSVDEYSLAHYHAKLLADKTITEYLKAAYDGRLLVHNPGRLANGLFGGYETFKDSNIDPTYRSDVDESYYPVLDDLQEILRAQLSRNPYWETSLEAVTAIGQIIASLISIKLMSQDKLGPLLRRLNEVKL